jgi:two-component system cell cycle sensor histidine kinase/response regulator CckA
MPDMPGDVLIARARALRPGLPVIVLTGHPHDAEVLGERTSDSSMRLLSKPISGRELADEIDSMLGRVPSA